MPHRAGVVLGLVLAAMAAGGCAAANALPGARLTSDMAGAEREFEAAMALVANLRYEEASLAFAPLVERFESAETADRPRAAESTFWLGYCHEKLGAGAKAATSYRRVLERYPDLPAARQAEQRLRALEDALGGGTKAGAGTDESAFFRAQNRIC